MDESVNHDETHGNDHSTASTGKIRRVLRVLRELPLFSVGIILIVLVTPAIFAEHIAPHDPFHGSLRDRLLPPAFLGGSSEFLLGTDHQGRDVFSRLVFGARVSAIVAATGIFIGGTIGVTLGVCAGYFRGWFDAVVSRAVDLTLSVPIILIAITLAVAIGASFGVVITVVAVFLWGVYARQVRGETLKWTESDFIRRAEVVGASKFRIIVRHLLPNMVNTIMVLVTLQVGFVIVFESSLSFIGVGIPRPNPAWGLMVSDARLYVITAWWTAFFPGLAIMLTVLAFNVLGDWLRDKLDPKLRQV